MKVLYVFANFQTIMNKFIFISLMGIIALFFSANEVLAQQVVNEAVKEEIADTSRETTLPVDMTLLTSIAGTVGGLLWKDKKDKNEIIKQLRESIDISMGLNACYIKFFNACVLYPEKNPKQILDLKSNNNALDEITLKSEMAIQVRRYQEFAKNNLRLEAPSMSTPTDRVINATTLVPENKVVEIAGPPKPSPQNTQNTQNPTS